jgi:hypothetical protein
VNYRKKPLRAISSIEISQRFLCVAPQIPDFAEQGISQTPAGNSRADQ